MYVPEPFQSIVQSRFWKLTGGVRREPPPKRSASPPLKTKQDPSKRWRVRGLQELRCVSPRLSATIWRKCGQLFRAASIRGEFTRNQRAGISGRLGSSGSSGSDGVPGRLRHQCLTTGSRSRAGFSWPRWQVVQLTTGLSLFRPSIDFRYFSLMS